MAGDLAAADLGIGVAYVEPVRRIAARVRLSGGAGRYFAIGSSGELRDRVEAALAKLLDGRVVTLDLSAAEGDPWNWILRHRPEGEGRTLICARGLGALAAKAEAAGNPSPYAQLNLSRDAWGATGTHLLLWIDGFAAFDEFLRLAPDLWSHRDVVGWFLRYVDFAEPALDDRAIRESEEREIERARRILGDRSVSAWERASAGITASNAMNALGREIEALQAVEAARAAARLIPSADPGGRSTSLRAEQVRAARLDWLGRKRAAAIEAGRALQAADLPDWMRPLLEQTVANALAFDRPEDALPRLRRVLLSGLPSVARDATRVNLVMYLGTLGRIRDARRVCAEVEGTLLDAREQIAAEILEASGESAEALSAYARAARLRLVQRTPGSTSRARVGAILDNLGITEDADAILAEHTRGDATVVLPDLVRVWFARSRRGSQEAPSSFAHLLQLVAELTSHSVARAVAARECERLADLLRGSILPGDPVIPRLEAAVRDLQKAAKADDDKEVDGSARWTLALLAELRADPKTAYKLADGHLVPWTRAWRGLIAESAVWALLARTAPTPSIAVERAKQSVAVADRSPSIYAQIDARRTFAAVRVREGNVPVALALLDEALALARAEGLRPRELAILHESAEIDHPGAKAAANDALTLAGAMMLPRDEARALLNLVRMARRHGEPVATRRLERAAEIVAELGPPRLRAEVEQACREAAVPVSAATARG